MPSTKPAARRADAAARPGRPGDGVGRGDERIGAVVDVEQHALRAFEQDPLAARAAPRRGRATPAARTAARTRRSRRGRLRSRCAVDRRFLEARRAARRGARTGGRAAGRDRRGGRGRRRGSRGGRPCPHRPGRCRAASCRSCRRPTRPRASASRSRWMGRISGQVSATISTSGVTSTPCSRDALDLGLERPRVEHHAVADHRRRAADDARSGAATTCRSGRRRPACGRHCGRPGSARPCRRGWPASRRSCPCPRRPTARR